MLNVVKICASESSALSVPQQWRPGPPSHSLGHKTFWCPSPPTLSFSPFSPATLSSFLLHSVKGHAGHSASPVPFFLLQPPPHPPQPASPARDKERRMTVVLRSQVFSFAAPGRNSSSPHAAAALPSLSLCISIVHPPTPRWFIGHTGKPF